MNRILIVLVLSLTAILAAHAATNFSQYADVIELSWATTSPSANQPVVKSTSKATGAIVGVALDGTATANETVHVKTSGVFNLSVTATVATMAVGDFIYGSVAGDVGVCTTALSDTNTGVLFGKAMAQVSMKSPTAAVTVPVLIEQPKHL